MRIYYIAKKKTYLAPVMKVVEIKEADIICTSPGDEISAFSIEGSAGYEEVDW